MLIKKLLLLFLASTTALADGRIQDADISASAAINVSKLAPQTASSALVTDSSGYLVASPVSSAQIGYLINVSSDLQAQINSKQGSLTPGNVSTSTTGVTITNGSSSTIGPNVSVDVQNASAAQPGLLTASDWNAFNGKQAALPVGTSSQYLRGDLTDQTLDTSVVPENGNLYFTNARAQGAVSATAPIVDTGGVFSIPQATTAVNGFLSATDWTTFNSKQNALGYTPLNPANNLSDVLSASTSLSNLGGQPLLSTYAVPANQFLTGYGSGTFTAAQPSFSNISGSLPLTQLSAQAADTFVANGTGSGAVPTAISAATAASILPAVIGDSGSGGTQGLVPAPASGTYAAGDYLNAGGTFSYVDQSHPQYQNLNLLSQTAFSGNGKFENIKLYTGITGKQYAVVAAGGSSATMVIYDVTDQANPVQTSATVVSGSYSIDVSNISGTIYAFIGSSGSNHVWIYNITNPYSPSVVTNFPITAVTTSIYGVKYYGGYLYCATQNQGLVVLDVGGGASGGTITVPVVAYNENTTLGGTPRSFGVAVATIGGTPYVFTTQYTTSVYTTRQIKSWSISTPQTPALLQSLQVTTVGEILGITITGNTAVVGVTASGVNAYDLIDVTTPSSMSNLSQISAPSGYAINSAFVAPGYGNYIYAPWAANTTYGGEVQVYNIANRSSPYLLSSVVTNVASSAFGPPVLDPAHGYMFVGDYGVSGGGSSSLDVFSMPQINPVLENPIADTLTVLNGITGNASTATQFAATPSSCSGGQYVIGISANGTPTCGTPSGAGTVTSVGLADGSTTPIFTITGSPVTGAGTLTETLNSQTANTFLAAPNVSSGQPSFRSIVAADIPTLNQNTTGTAANITATSNSTLTSIPSLSLPTTQLSGTITNAQLANSATTVNGQSCALGGTCTISASPTAIGAYSVLSNNTSGSAAPAGNQSLFLGDPGFVGSGTFSQYTGSANSYLQSIFQNTNPGSSASSDLIVANNLGTDTAYYGDFGINSSNFSGTGSLSLPNATYLYAQSGDLAIGTGSANAVHIVANGGATDAITVNSSNAVILPGYTGYVYANGSSQIGAVTPSQEAPSGTINSSNTSFTLTYTPIIGTKLSLYRDGMILVQGTDYTISGSTITMTSAPLYGETLYATYDH